MKHYDTIFLDRDGTLNPDPGYIRSLEQFRFFDFTLPALESLSTAGYQFCIVTNQSGIGRGLIEPEALEAIHQFIREAFRKRNISLLDIYYCPDHPDRATDFRKPGTEMFLQAAAEHGLDLTKSLMIGDAASDMEAGVNLKMDTMLVLTGKGRQTKLELKKQFQPTYIVEDLGVGAQVLLGEVE